MAVKVDASTISGLLIEKGIEQQLAISVSQELAREMFVTMETLSSLSDQELVGFGLRTRGERRMFRLAFGTLTDNMAWQQECDSLSEREYDEPTLKRQRDEAGNCLTELAIGVVGSMARMSAGDADNSEDYVPQTQFEVRRRAPKKVTEKRPKVPHTADEIVLADVNAELLQTRVPFQAYWKRRREPDLATTVIRIEKDPDGRQGGLWAPVLKFAGNEGKPRGVAVLLHRLAKSKGYTTAATSVDGYKDLYYKDSASRWHPLRDTCGSKHRNGRAILSDDQLPGKEEAYKLPG